MPYNSCRFIACTIIARCSRFMLGTFATLYQTIKFQSVIEQSRLCLAYLLLFSLFMTCPLLSSEQNAYGQNNQQQLKNLQQDISSQQKSVFARQEERGKLQKKLHRQEQLIAQVGKSLHDMQQQLDNLNKEIVTLNSSSQKLREQYKIQQHYLAQQIEQIFRQGKSAPLALLFDKQEAQHRERILAYVNYLNLARERSLQKLQATQTELQQQKVELQHNQQQVQQLATEKDKENKKLQASQQERKKTLASLQRLLEQQQQKLQKLQQNEKNLRDKITRAEQLARERAQREARKAERIRQKEQQAQKSGSAYQLSQEEQSLMARTGGLGRPAKHYSWPVYGTILHHFGDIDQGELRWKGLVISAAEGKEVKAIADGYVLLADWLQGYGLVVVIEHGQGDMSLYGYNQTSLVTVNSRVKAGQPIALVGNSGGQQQSALYFEIRRQGQAVNPQPWLE